MTPERFLRELERLVADQQWQPALAFASTFGDAVSPVLSAEELDRVQGLMEVAANIAHLAASPPKDEVEALPGPTER
jgi:hypothetical protein